MNPGLTIAPGVRFCDMEKKAIILETADELRAARSRQPLISAEECEAQRLRHRRASEAFAEAAKNGTSKPGRVKVAAGWTTSVLG
jgi:hypothetical protein